MSPAPVFVQIPGSHHPGTRLRLVPGFRDPRSILILGQVTQYGNTYLICITSHQSDQQFLRYTYFEIWPWKIQDQGHEGCQSSRSHGSIVIQSMHFSFHVNRANHSCDMAIKVFDLEKNESEIKIWMQKEVSNRNSQKSNHVISLARGI